MCVLVSLMFLGPRGAGIIWWLISPARWELTFSSGAVAFFGVLLLPWTTLMYVAVAPYGVGGFDYVLLALAVMVDISSYGGGGAYGRRRETALA
jgi:hypothetical protein